MFLTTASESTWSNENAEKQNQTVATMRAKITDDIKCSHELTLYEPLMQETAYGMLLEIPISTSNRQKPENSLQYN